MSNDQELEIIDKFVFRHTPPVEVVGALKSIREKFKSFDETAQQLVTQQKQIKELLDSNMALSLSLLVKK
jgi:hypothetical protein